MPVNEDELLELAFKAEKYGDRNEAIRLYRKVATEGSEQAAYAEKCAENLEKLGAPPETNLDDLDVGDSAVPGASSSNPFAAPTGGDQPSKGTLEYDTTHRIQVTSTIVKSLSLFCVLVSVFRLWWISIGLSGRFGFVFLDYSLVVVLLVVARLGWIYSKEIQQLQSTSSVRIDNYSKPQLRLWAGIGILAAIRFARELLFFFPVYDL